MTVDNLAGTEESLTMTGIISVSAFERSAFWLFALVHCAWEWCLELGIRLFNTLQQDEDVTGWWNVGLADVHISLYIHECTK